MPADAAAPKIVCVALNPAIDRTLEVQSLELGQHAKGRLLSRHPAGKAVNVAHVLQRLGQPSILTGFVGEGERAMYEASFDSKIVRTQLFGIASPTRENITLVDGPKGIETHIRDEGSGILDDDRQRLFRKLKILAKPDIWMVFAGSLPRGFDLDQFREILRAVVAKGACVVLDSSEGALGVVKKLSLWLIKPNREELTELTGQAVESEQQLVAAARSLRDAARSVLVSAGEHGCYLVEGPAALHGYMERLPRRVTNTVGCGDALLAGFLAARARGAEPRECVQNAVACGTSATFQLRAGEVDADEVPGLAAQVKVDDLSA